MPRVGANPRSSVTAPGGDHRRGRPPKTDDNLGTLLATAAALMARHGYEQTSIRDVARDAGFSLAGMYYYFRGKEELLYKIQDRTFSSLLAEQEELISQGGRVRERLHRVVGNHLSYLTRHADELKVCTYELESLNGVRYRRIERLRRRYYKLMAGLMGEILRVPPHRRRTDRNVRHYTLFVFGMLNWTLMWFDPKRDEPTGELADKMVGMILRGRPTTVHNSRGASGASGNPVRRSTRGQAPTTKPTTARRRNPGGLSVGVSPARPRRTAEGRRR